MFFAALLTAAEALEQPRCPSGDKQIEMMRDTYSVAHHAAVKKNEMMPLATTWMNLEVIALSKRDRERQKKRKMKMNLRTTETDPQT